MLEDYFVKPETLDRIRASWIGEPIERYVEWMEEQGYAARNVPRRVPMLFRFGEFAAERGASRLDELPAHVEAFVLARLDSGGGYPGAKARQDAAAAIRSVIVQMLRLVLSVCADDRQHLRVSWPFVGQAPGFLAYLRDERGLREASIYHYGHHLRRFEAYLDRIGCHDLGALSAQVLGDFVIDAAESMGRSAMIGQCSSLRVFLSYLRLEGVVARNLANSVELPQVYRLADLPRSISWDDVRRMLDAVDRRAPIGRRDYALLLLLVTYGLRAREVARLALDDIDWKRDRLHVRERKAGHVAVYPLSPVVGEAIVDYLKRGRPPAADRRLFLEQRAPHRPFRCNAVSARASHYLHKVGVTVRRPGSHTLRHACVQHLVDAGFSLKTIGDYVGHRSASSTEVYAKVAIETLRDVGLGNGEALP